MQVTNFTEVLSLKPNIWFHFPREIASVFGFSHDLYNNFAAHFYFIFSPLLLHILYKNFLLNVSC